MKLKKKHHYVSQFYLKAWSIQNDQIFASDEKRPPFLVKTNATAYSKFFYRVNPLSVNGIFALDNIARMLNANDTIIYEKVIKSINRVIYKTKIFQDSFAPEQYDSIHELNETIKEVQTNCLEDYFAFFEDKVSIIFKKILQTKVIHLDWNYYQLLIFFITLQLLRTRKTIDQANKEFHKYHPNLTKDEMYTISIYTSLIMNSKLSQSLISNLHTLHIINNNTNLNIITSDNPCINYKFHETNNTEFECIFPLSPHIYLILKENSYSESTKKFILTDIENKPNENLINTLIFLEETSDLNKIIWVNSLIKKHKNRYVYAQNYKDLK